MRFFIPHIEKIRMKSVLLYTWPMSYSLPIQHGRYWALR